MSTAIEQAQESTHTGSTLTEITPLKTGPPKLGKKILSWRKALSEPENQFLEKLFQKYPPRIIISFHSWKPMLNFNGDCEKVAQFLESYNSYPVVAEIEGSPNSRVSGEHGPENTKPQFLHLNARYYQKMYHLERFGRKINKD